MTDDRTREIDLLQEISLSLSSLTDLRAIIDLLEKVLQEQRKQGRVLEDIHRAVK